MKAYTDIEQSKKLVEILSPESADMYWEYDFTKHECVLKIMDEQFDDNCVRAWSLAALFDLIPQEIFNGEYIINITEGCDTRWVLTYDHFENRNHSYFGLSSGGDNLIDAAYKMILRLYEHKLL